MGLKEGGIPIGGAIFDETGQLIGAGHNRRVQQGAPSVHGETDAFRKAGRQKSYRKLIMVTTLAPCWYCSGLVRQFGFGTVIIGEVTFITNAALTSWQCSNSFSPSMGRTRKNSIPAAIHSALKMTLSWSS